MIIYAVFASMKIIAVEHEIILCVLKQGFTYQNQLVLGPSCQDQDHENFGISGQTGSGPITIGKFRTYSDRHDRTDYRSYLAIFIAKFAVIFPLWSSHSNSPSYYHPISHLNARLIWFENFFWFLFPPSQHSNLIFCWILVNFESIFLDGFWWFFVFLMFVVNISISKVELNWRSDHLGWSLTLEIGRKRVFVTIICWHEFGYTRKTKDYAENPKNAIFSLNSIF